VQVDYTYPITGNSTLETGIKGNFNEITSSVAMNVYDLSAGEYIFDPLQSYNFRYSLDIFAAYVSTNFKLFNWLDLKPGVRYEYSDIGISYPGASVPSYGTLVPSILLAHSFGENRSLQLTYSRRIRRPDYNNLNPFVNRSDPYNIETGNVLLRPEVGERIELGYNTGLGKGGNMKISLTKRIDTRDIEPITTFYPLYTAGDSTYSNVSVTTSENIGSDNTTGLNIFAAIPVSSRLNLRTNLMLFNGYMVRDQGGERISTGFSFRGNMNATWQLPRKFLAEFFGFWRSGGKGIQGREPQFYIYNLALRKLFWNDNGSFGFTATNFLSRNIRQISTVTTGNSTSRNVRELPFRSFGLSFSYKFGKIQSKKDKNNEEEGFDRGLD
jgi:outer membrane receptor protein involved in Fe transport